MFRVINTRIRSDCFRASASDFSVNIQSKNVRPKREGKFKKFNFYKFDYVEFLS